jgi:FkbM family methyltransferase
MLKSLLRRLVRDAHWAFLSWHRYRFGLFATLPLYPRLLINDQRIGIATPLSSGRVFIRPDTADERVFDEIFIAREYELDLGRPKVIIDAGAHIGLASVYFAIRYPEAMIIALEPEASNFAVLAENARPYPNIHPLKAGLWSHETTLRIHNPQAATWSFRVEEVRDGEGIAAFGIEDLRAMFGLDRIDILKMDIEGSEQVVLTRADAWIGHVDTLIVELHDRYQPGCTEALERVAQNGHFARSRSGENMVLRRMESAAEPPRERETALSP